jgi:hypothetical protein
MDHLKVNKFYVSLVLFMHIFYNFFCIPCLYNIFDQQHWFAAKILKEFGNLSSKLATIISTVKYSMFHVRVKSIDTFYDQIASDLVMRKLMLCGKNDIMTLIMP